FRHPVAMAHPDLVLLAGIPDAVEEFAALADIEKSAAEFAVMAALHLAAELGADGLLTVADAEDRQAEIKHLLRGARRVFLGGGSRAAGEDHAFQPAMGTVCLQRLAGFLEGHDLAVDARLPHAAGNELGDLRTEIDNKNALRHRRSFNSSCLGGEAQGRIRGPSARLAGLVGGNLVLQLRILRAAEG